MKRLFLGAAFALTAVVCAAQSRIIRDFTPVCDSVSVLLQERNTVSGELKLKNVLKRGSVLDFYFNDALADMPWTKDDIKWLRNTMASLMPKGYSNCSVGRIYSKKSQLENLVTEPLRYDGSAGESAFRVRDPERISPVREIGGMEFPRGLSGRNLAVWQSHGRFFDENTGCWRWQRPLLFTTCEDMLTQGFVIPFLIPMLENAGAYVMTPRERDIQANESICDNDRAFEGERDDLVRTRGTYREYGKWEDGGVGFADAKEVYIGNDNPFTMGTVRTAKVSSKKAARAVWTPEIRESGRYAVYVSYRSFPNSSQAARYTVRHAGGTTEFAVNQKMGGGTWIYLGTFGFDPEGEYSVTLDNSTPEGFREEKGAVVCADAVKFGGGMGRLARGCKDVPKEEWTVSGMPAYMEGALYWMQMAGIDTTVTRQHEGDYTNDFADRGAWVQYLSGGSGVNPKQKGLGIPFDCSLAFHTDAGVTPDDSIVGSLAIYTLLADGSRKYADGSDRMAARQLCDFVQSQVVGDIRAKYNPLWSRRELTDRSYSECRTTGVPGMILELLSHQNFADMKYALDPAFRFDVGRAVYKGILKFLSNRYGCPYSVQPLPVNNFSAVIDNGKVELNWSPAIDETEPTATPEGYILYVREDGGSFGKGMVVRETGASMSLVPGHIYSFKVEAFNAGGRSFPSEILSVGIPRESKGTVLIVNNFTRVSAPAWFDTPDYAGFDMSLDGGVPYGEDITFAGQMYQYRRDMQWEHDDNPGFGASYADGAGIRSAGNTFDYPFIHGKALLACGYSFCSMGADAFEGNPSGKGYTAVDIICGKQVTTTSGEGLPERFRVFPEGLQQAIRTFAGEGGNIIVSGSNIGTDIWDRVYPVSPDSTYRAGAKKFAEEVLGWRWRTNYASRSGKVWPVRVKGIDLQGLPPQMGFASVPNGRIYCVETPDGLSPAGKKSHTFLRYKDTNISAAVCCDKGSYRAISFGFPIETLENESDIEKLLTTTLKFFEQ